MTVGELDLEEFLSEYPPRKTYVIIYNCGGEVKPLIVDKKITELLKGFKGNTELMDVIKTKSLSWQDEAREFIQYAVSETILYIT